MNKVMLFKVSHKEQITLDEVRELNRMVTLAWEQCNHYTFNVVAGDREYWLEFEDDNEAVEFKLKFL